MSDETFVVLFVSFDDMPKINWGISYSPVHVIVHGTFYLKKVRKSRVPREIIRIISFTGLFVVQWNLKVYDFHVAW